MKNYKHFWAPVCAVLLAFQIRTLILIKIHWDVLINEQSTPAVTILVPFFIIVCSLYLFFIIVCSLYLYAYCSEIFPKIKNKFNNSK